MGRRTRKHHAATSVGVALIPRVSFDNRNVSDRKQCCEAHVKGQDSQDERDESGNGESRGKIRPPELSIKQLAAMSVRDEAWEPGSERDGDRGGSLSA